MILNHCRCATTPSTAEHKASSPRCTDPELLRQRESASLPGDQERAVPAAPSRPGGQRLQGRILRGRVRAGPQSHPVSPPASHLHVAASGLPSTISSAALLMPSWPAETAEAATWSELQELQELQRFQSLIKCWRQSFGFQGCSLDSLHTVKQNATMSKAIWEFPR